MKSYVSGDAKITGDIGEAQADRFFEIHGLYSVRPPGPDIGIDRIVKLHKDAPTSVKIQIKGRRQKENPRWFQLSVPAAHLVAASILGQDLNDLWKSRIDMVDFWVLVSIPHDEIWVFPSKIIHEIAGYNYRKYHTRQDNDYSQVHTDKKGKIVKKQKELNLDIFDDSGVPLHSRYKAYLNDISPIVEFLNK